MKKSSLGLSLIELMVVMVIISILVAASVYKFKEGSAQSRDAERQANLRTLQSAIELYKHEHGRYPAGCNGGWSGQSGTDYACAAGNHYIVGLAPGYIPTLPNDAKLNGTNSGYVYKTNTDGTVYKLIAYRTVEELSVIDPAANLSNKIVDSLREFKLCDADGISGDPTLICNGTDPSNPWGGGTPGHCVYNSPLYQDSYALWGGYANPVNPTPVRVERYTEEVICDAP